MEAFIATIMMFGGNFAPRGWALCQGQIMSISQNTALFSLLGTTYGGDGIQTFALPDLRGRMPMGTGQGPGLTPRQLGESGGSESVTLTVNNLPAHNHQIAALSNTGDQASPANHFSAGGGTGMLPYSSRNDSTMNPAALSLTGGNQPVATESPFLALNFIICLEGIFPSRN
ncbi:phage tail protein [Nannocystaceae bacterium ST9]